MLRNVISNVKIKYKLGFVSLVPIIALLVVSLIQVTELQKKASAQAHLIELMEISVAANNLVHELQKERGKSAGYINSKGKNFSDSLPVQRQNTDIKAKKLQDVLSHVDVSLFGSKYVNQLNKALEDLDRIAKMRKEISALNLPLAKVVGYYTTMNGGFLEITNKAIAVSQDPDLIRDISAYVNFSQSKERAGVERAVGAAGFGGGWSVALLDKFKHLITVQDTYIKVFLTFATDEEREFFAKETSDSSFKNVQDMRDVVVKKKSKNIDAAHWFETITKKINVLKKIEDHLAHDVMHLAEEGAQKSLAQRNVYVLAVSILLIAVVIITFATVKDLLRSITSTQDVMAELAKENDNVPITGLDRKDEIGDMAKSLEVLKEGLIERKKMEQAALETQARAEEEKRQAMQDLAAEFDNQVGGLISSLSTASGQLQGTAQDMKQIAEQTSQSSSVVAVSTEDASSNVNTVASAMEEMSASSKEIASQVISAKEQSNDTASNAKSANETVGNLNERVANIGEVVISIKDIAEQTNLLALNATIEAARAGDAGKGFAVVADEVKKLANETAIKTEEIEQRISEIQVATQDSVHAMERIISNISEIDGSVTGVSAAVEQQNSTNTEIVRSITEASQGVHNVSQTIGEVQEGASQTRISADEVLSASTSVAEMSNTLSEAVEKFLAQIRNS